MSWYFLKLGTEVSFGHKLEGKVDGLADGSYRLESHAATWVS